MQGVGVGGVAGRPARQEAWNGSRSRKRGACRPSNTTTSYADPGQVLFILPPRVISMPSSAGVRRPPQTTAFRPLSPQRRRLGRRASGAPVGSSRIWGGERRLFRGRHLGLIGRGERGDGLPPLPGQVSCASGTPATGLCGTRPPACARLVSTFQARMYCRWQPSVPAGPMTASATGAPLSPAMTFSRATRRQLMSGARPARCSRAAILAFSSQ